MLLFLTRYERDESRPTLLSAARDVAVRAVLPAVALLGVILTIGWIIIGPLQRLPNESLINARVQQYRSTTWDAVTRVWSMIGNTEIIIGTCLLVSAIIWWRTRQWWLAVTPGIAISLQASVFVAASSITARSRPEVEHLDPAPPTSSYPSGHAGAATALYLTFALLAHQIARPWVRRVTITGCLLVPLLVAFARLYRGMHFLLDILVGMLNGLLCAVLAWGYLRRDGRMPGVEKGGSQAGVTRTGERVDGIRGEPESGHQQQRGAKWQAGEGT